MTTLFKTRTAMPSNGAYVPLEVMHPTKGAAESYATEQRKDGIDTEIFEIDLKKTGIETGLSNKQLMCALYNRQGYVDTQISIKQLPGIKSARRG